MSDTSSSDTEDDESVIEVSENISYTWIIKGFSNLSKELGFNKFSPVFPESKKNSEWKIQFYPNGYKDEKYCGLYLVLVNIHERKKINTAYSLMILDSEDEIAKSIEVENRIFNEPFESWGFNEFWEIDQMEQHVYHDKLKIRVTIHVTLLELDSLHKIKKKNACSVMKLVTDIHSLLNQGDFCDLIINVDGAEIKAHKAILAARSAVFSAMFRNDTSERKSGIVEITDINKNTFLALIKFMYTAEVDFSTAEDAKNLFFAADKYEVVDLKDLCENYLMSNLKESNIMDILIFSDRHSAWSLKNKAVQYVLENGNDLIKSERFDELQEEPKLIIEILAESFLKLQDLT